MNKMLMQPIAGIWLICFFFQSVNSQWSKLPWINGGPIISFTANDSAIYAKTYWGDGTNSIYKSVDNGIAWESVADRGLPTEVPGVLLFADSIILINTRNGIYRSTDYGATWNRSIAYSSVPQRGSPVSFAVTSGSNIITGGEHVYRSSDYGKSWDMPNLQFVLSWRSWSPPISFALCNTKILAMTRGTVYLSNDSGENWSDIIGGNQDDLSAVSIIDTTLFVAGKNRLLISNDNAVSWTTVFFQSDIDSLAAGKNTLFAKTDDAIFRSVDKGTNWTSVYSEASVKMMAVSENSIALLTDDQIVLSTDNGNTWTGVYKDTAVISLAIGGKAIIANTNSDVVLSADNGVTWSSIACRLPTNSIVSLGMNDDELYAITDNYANHECNVSLLAYRQYCHDVDTKEGWASVNLDFNDCPENPDYSAFSNYNVRKFLRHGNILVASSYTICHSWPYSTHYLSTDNGVNWTKTHIVNYILENNGVIFQGTEKGIYRSTDHGASWMESNSGLPYFKISESLFYPNVNSIVANESAIFAATDSGIYSSTDNGINWQISSSGLPEQTAVTSLVAGEGKMFAGNAYGVYLSNDNVKSWFSISSSHADITNSIATYGKNKKNNIYISNKTLFVHSDSVWYCPVSELPDLSSLEMRPEATRKIPIIIRTPNRTDPLVVVTFSLPSQMRVSVTIHDLRGIQIATLVKRTLHSGAHRLSWDSRNAGPGNYIMSIQTEQTSNSKNIVILH